MEKVKLEKEKLKHLLENSDIKWFQSHDGHYEYRAHLDFVADYIVSNYNRTRGGAKVKPKC